MDITDTGGIHFEFPIFGQEDMEIIYRTTDSDKYPPITRKFKVYKMTNKNQTGYNAVKYRLHFVSEEWITNETIKISKSYKNKANSDIVQDVFSLLKSSKKFNIEKSINSQKIILPYMSPFSAISWLSSYSVSSKNSASSYIFFENNSGFNFVSLDSLYSQNPIDKWSLISKLASSDIVTEDKKDLGLNDISHVQTFDILGNIAGGMLGSMIQTYDITTRSYKTIKFDYFKDFNKMKHLEDGDSSVAGLYTKDSNYNTIDSCKKFIITPTDSINSNYIKSKKQDSEIFSKKREESIQLRISQLLQLNQFQSNISIPGDSRLSAGAIMDIEIPSYAITENKKENSDPYYSGKHLIKKIKHQYTGNTYTNEIELLRDSVKSPRKNVKVEKKN